MTRVLSVDWDFFFPMPQEDASTLEWLLYDWGHKENEFYINGPLWPIRAEAFLRNNKSLPGTSGEERNFWSQFHIMEDAPLFVSESHSAMVAEPLFELLDDDEGSILSFDAHHDCGYTVDDLLSVETGFWHCGNWGLFYLNQGLDVEIKYPLWKQDAFKTEHTRMLNDIDLIEPYRSFAHYEEYSEVIEAVFICRSGAWTPPWLDSNFDQFVESCPSGPPQYLGVDSEFVDALPAREFTAPKVELSDVQL